MVEFGSKSEVCVTSSSNSAVAVEQLSESFYSCSLRHRDRCVSTIWMVEMWYKHPFDCCCYKIVSILICVSFPLPFPETVGHARALGEIDPDLEVDEDAD